MHWLERLAQLYCADDLPLYHDEVYTDIEVRLSVGGYFLGARHARMLTTIPVTELSEARTSGIHPHPLSDTLGYVAGDMHSRFAQGNEQYLGQLGRWSASQYATTELRAVYDYLSRKRLLADLSYTDAPASFGKAGLEKAVVRFVVGEAALWQDKALQDSHISYMRSLGGSSTVCCLSGAYSEVARLHPRHITGEASVAKLISSAMLPIGREISFMAHAVLRRLIARHGIRIGSKVFVAWDDNGSGTQMSGEVTVLVLHEVSKGNLAVSLVGRADAVGYGEFAQEYSGCSGGSEDALRALHRLNRLIRGMY